jgi:hypothetical protein
MTFKGVVAASAGFIMAGTMYGDGSYQKTTQVTGGPAIPASLMKLTEKFMPDAKHVMDPNTEIMMVHGNRMVTVTINGSTIWDMDKGTMTTTDNKKRQYSVVTLQQMQDITKKFASNTPASTPLVPAQKKSNPDDPQVTVVSDPVQIQNTGAVKTFSGVTAKETVLTLKVTMKITDPKSGQSTSSESLCYLDVWKADKAPGYDDVQDFYRRLGEKMGNQAESQKIAAAWSSRPEAGGMSNVRTAANKIKGITVLEVERVSTLIGGQPLVPDLNSQQNAQKAPRGVLSETTTQLSNFSNQPVVTSEFDVPAGYKEVPSPIMQMLK